MALKIRKGTDAERLTVTPAAGELIYTTDTKQIFVGDGTTAGGVFVGPASSEALTLGGNLTLNGHDIVGTGNININGTVTATGNINLGNDNSDNIIFGGEVDSDIVPNNTNVYNLGSSSKTWSGGWINNLTATTITATDIVGHLDGDVEGSVFADNSTMLVDAVAGKIVGPVEANVTGNVTGNVIATDSTTLVNATTKTFTGNLTGNVTGDLSGSVEGTFSGQLLNGAGQVFLDTTSDVVPTLPTNIIGDVQGSVYSDGSTMLVDGTNGAVILDGTVKGNIIPAVDSNVSVGSSVYKFNNAYINGAVLLGSASTQSVSASGSNITLKGAIQTNSPISAILEGDIVGSSINSFVVEDALGIRAGATFKLPGTSLLTVDSVDLGTNTVTTTTTFTASDALDGATVIFYNPETAVSSYRFEIPATPAGSPGDKKGMVFATATHIYMCFDDYTDGLSDIWTRSDASTTWA
jgi:Major tropism determinant N-terminal domain